MSPFVLSTCKFLNNSYQLSQCYIFQICAWINKKSTNTPSIKNKIANKGTQHAQTNFKGFHVKHLTSMPTLSIHVQIYKSYMLTK